MYEQVLKLNDILKDMIIDASGGADCEGSYGFQPDNPSACPQVFSNSDIVRKGNVAGAGSSQQSHPGGVPVDMEKLGKERDLQKSKSGKEPPKENQVQIQGAKPAEPNAAPGLAKSDSGPSGKYAAAGGKGGKTPMSSNSI